MLDVASDPLLQPFTIKGLQLKNRIMSTSHAISYGQDGFPQERYQLYHEEKAKGGLALTMFGGSSVVSADSPSVFGQLDVSTDAIIPHFQAFARRIHAHDCKLMCQITHLGRRSTYQGNWLSPVAPSRIPGDMYGGIPKEMDEDDIHRVIADYGQAARRCYEGGLDGCEALATSHLLDQFWTPRFNSREDQWGGSLENRTRFSRMVFEEMRRQTSPDFILSLRMIMDEDAPGGLTESDCIEIAKVHTEAGLIDVLNLVHGAVDTVQGLAGSMPGMHMPLSPYLDKAGRFRAAVDVPVFHATRINDLATARHALRDGLVDMVGITRGHIADPHIVKKLTEGQEDRIRPCVGATYCSTYRQCIHNVATGREATMPHVIGKADRVRRAVVVGGGPSGMEAARVLSHRGHLVTLFEASDRLGGQVLLAARSGWRRDMIGIADWLAGEMQALGVDVRYGAMADPAMIAGLQPDLVICATGGVPDTDWISGDAEIISTWDALGGPGLTGEVLIHDALGKQQAMSAAEKICETAQVEITTPERMVGHGTGKIEAPIYLKTLYQRGVKMTPDQHLVLAERYNGRIRAVLANTLTGAEEDRIVDHLIVERGTVPNDELWRSLAPGSRNNGVTDINAMAAGTAQPALNGEGYTLYRIGDAVSCRDVHAAILDGLRLCKDL